MKCEWCASSKHPSDSCPIVAKMKAMEQGVPPEALFDAVIDASELLDLVSNPHEFIHRKQRRN